MFKSKKIELNIQQAKAIPSKFDQHSASGRLMGKRTKPAMFVKIATANWK